MTRPRIASVASQVVRSILWTSEPIGPTRGISGAPVGVKMGKVEARRIAKNCEGWVIDISAIIE
jgi:hypothetical protein